MALTTLISVASLLIAALAFISRRPFVAASALDATRRDLTELRQKLQHAEGRIKALEAHLGTAIFERDWWREQYATAKRALDRLSSNGIYSREKPQSTDVQV